MKRRRRLFTPELLLRIKAMAYGGEVLAPLSIVVAKNSVVEVYGRENFRVGYYGRQDGLNCVRLVNSKGEYEHWLDQRFVRENFDIVERSDEADVYGDNRPLLQPLAKAS